MREVIETLKGRHGIPLVCMLFFMFRTLPVTAQQVAVKTNMLYWLTTTPNVGAEFALTPKLTLNLSVGYNAWNLFSDDMSLRHYAFQPELRYWLCRKFEGHFAGVHAHYAAYDMGYVPFVPSMKEYMYKGNLYGAGITYGYHFILGRRWGLELAVGAGYARMDYKKYVPGDCCAEVISKVKRHYLGPTKFAVNLIYVIR